MIGPPANRTSRELSSRFDALLRRLGGRPNPELFSALVAAWAEPRRVYHGLEHLEDCLRECDAAPPGAADRDAVEAALWFHDAVYDPRAGDNEARSSAWARDALAGAGISPDVAAEVARLVLLTRHVTPPAMADAAGSLLCDVDLSILGRPPEDYDRFERDIRTEYAWVPWPVYRTERARILARFAGRQPLYRTPHFQRRYEASARANLQRAIGHLAAGETHPA
jgi:predicted metal-dependent HD superfamily phosphohydrolase